MGVFWRIGTKNRTVACILVGLEWLFIVLFVGTSSGIHHTGNDLYVVCLRDSFAGSSHVDTALSVDSYSRKGLHCNPSNDIRSSSERQYWCWVAQEFKAERIAGEYFWLWTALFTSILVYTPLFFWSQGMLSVNSSQWWRFRFHRSSPLVPDDDGRKRRALSMLAYVLILIHISSFRTKGDF